MFFCWPGRPADPGSEIAVKSKIAAELVASRFMVHPNENASVQPFSSESSQYAIRGKMYSAAFKVHRSTSSFCLLFNIQPFTLLHAPVSLLLSFITSLLLPATSLHHLRPRNVARLIQQRIHALQESHRMLQIRVPLKRRLIHPPRMDVEQPWVPHRPKGMKTQAASLLPQRLLHRPLLTLLRMQPHKHVLLHISPLPSPGPPPVDPTPPPAKRSAWAERNLSSSFSSLRAGHRLPIPVFRYFGPLYRALPIIHRPPPPRHLSYRGTIHRALFSAHLCLLRASALSFFFASHSSLATSPRLLHGSLDTRGWRHTPVQSILSRSLGNNR